MRGLLAEHCTPTWHTDNVEARAPPPPPPSREELRENSRTVCRRRFPHFNQFPSFIIYPATMFNVMHRKIGIGIITASSNSYLVAVTLRYKNRSLCSLQKTKT